MPKIDHEKKKLKATIAYYGPGLAGKTTNLQFLAGQMEDSNKASPLTWLATETERSLYFDFLPYQPWRHVKGYKLRITLDAAVGSVFYDASCRRLLQDVSGIVFVVDSQVERHHANVETFMNLNSDLKKYGHDPGVIPVVFQYNKRDLGNAEPIAELQRALNPLNAPYVESIASKGVGVCETLQRCIEVIHPRLEQWVRENSP